MYILIDTNIFFNNWFLSSPHFTFLVNFANNTGAKLLLSSVVSEEVGNKYKLAREEFNVKVDSLRSDFRDLKIAGSILPKPNTDFEYDFKLIVTDKFESVEIIPYSNVSHEILMHKALHSLRPFRGKDKGYRDSLIWLSLLTYLDHVKNSCPISFISNNSSDFFEIKDGESFLHPHLLSDVTQEKIKNKFLPYVSLKAFVESIIDTKTHAFNHQEFKDEHGDEFESVAADAAITYLNSLSPYDCKNSMVRAGYPVACISLVSSFRFEDYEGVEDPDVIHISDVGDDKVFIKYQFNLLTVSFKGIVPTEGYFSEKEAFDKFFLNVSDEGINTEIESFPRVYYEASIIFNRVTKVVSSVSIDSATIRYRY